MSEAQEDGVIIEEVPKEANSLKRCHVADGNHLKTSS